MSIGRWVLPAVALAGAAIGAVGMYVGSGAGVRGYLLAHPEVIQEAMQKLQDRESGRLIAQHRAEITRPFAGAWAGNPRGDVTVVEYFDYNCGYCRASLPIVAELLAKDPQLRLVYRELPILAPESRVAARASLAAAAAGPQRYRAFHAALYGAGPTSPATIAAAARQAGVDPAAVTAGGEAEIDRNLRVADSLRFSGTPTWIIGDRVLTGAQTLEVLEEAVAATRGR